MHEMGIAMDILRIVQESIPAEMVGARVQRVNLRVGKFSAIVPDSLRFCFNVAAANTVAAGAELAVEEVPVVARCNDCGHAWTIEDA
ncbi:MAG: hydrogenase maturation nickel metallochaperone HypA, partial [Desulfatitalea sp.]|nr:hydrogenase maturation nickel metallochaperone HypA [Desulfatitalea sp.]